MAFNIIFVWIRLNRAAVQECPFEEPEPDDQLRAELRQKNLEANYTKIRELIGKPNHIFFF